MNNKLLRQIACTSVLSAAVIACGDGSDTTSRGGGIGGTGISVAGPVTAFGSVYVNGVKFNTDNSDIFVNGLASSEDALNLGMMVRVEGEVNPDGTGTATHIYFDGELEGPVTQAAQIDANDNQIIALQVLGVPVKITAATHFDGMTFEQVLQDLSLLSDGEMVEISGQYDAQGVLQASYIEFENDTFTANETEIELRGELLASNDGDDTWLLVVGQTEFVLDTTAVDTSAYQSGQLVLVEGTLTELASNVIVVSEFESAAPADDSEVEIQGLITELTNQNEFVVDGVKVDASQAEKDTPVELTLNTQVEVEGTYSNGVLVASEVELIDAPEFDEVEVIATLSEVDAELQTVTLDISGNSLTVNINNRTEWEDERDGERRVNLASLNAGDVLELELQQAQNTWLATEVARIETQPGVQIQAPVSQDTFQADNQTISVLGVTYTLDANAEVDLDGFDNLTQAFEQQSIEELSLIDMDNDGDIDELSLDD